jgi:hypothetical protein
MHLAHCFSVQESATLLRESSPHTTFEPTVLKKALSTKTGAHSLLFPRIADRIDAQNLSWHHRCAVHANCARRRAANRLDRGFRRPGAGTGRPCRTGTPRRGALSASMPLMYAIADNDNPRSGNLPGRAIDMDWDG